VPRAEPMPGTVAPLVNCQNVQPAHPDGSAGRAGAYAASHSGSDPKAALSAVQSVAVRSSRTYAFRH
jgi:hypothetical protein